jgi:CBS domain-containing protein
MRVADLMRPNVVTIRRDATVTEAVTLLADQHISALAVVDEHGRMIGVLSVTDLLRAEAEVEEDRGRTTLFEDTRIDELMSPRPITIEPDAPVREAARQMLYAEVHRIFVEADGELVGVISQTDLVRAVAQGAV